MATFYLDYVNGSDANNGSSWALAWKTITSGATAARIAPGDVIRIAKSPDPTSLGQTASWTNLLKTVTLTSAVTVTVSDCEAAWTAGTLCTVTADASVFKENTKSCKIVTGALVGAQEIAYLDLGSTQDYSGYWQLSLWFRNETSALASAGDIKIKFFSDAARTAEVENFNIPAIPSTVRWLPITINKGSAISSTVRAVSVYANIALASKTFYLDDLVVCKDPSSADSLTLQSLISKNSAAQTGTEFWYGIQSINGTTVKIDNSTNTLGSQGRGYSGTTESVTTYKRETIKVALTASTSGTEANIQDSGTVSSYIEFQGGYNTASTTQDGITFFDALNGLGFGLEENNQTYIRFNQLAYYRYTRGVNVNSSNNGAFDFGYMYAGCCDNYGIIFSGIAPTRADRLVGINNSIYGVYPTGLVGAIINEVYALNNISSGMNSDASSSCNNIFKNIISKNNNGYAFTLFPNMNNNNKILAVTSSDNVSGGFAGGYSDNYLYNASISESTEFTTSNSFYNARYYSQDHDNVTGAAKIFTDGGLIQTNTSVRHTASGFSWQISPTSTNRSSTYPLYFRIARVACNASELRTIKAWMRRDNTGLTMSLVCRGGQLSGVSSDVISSMTAAANTWEEITITFTPSEAGVIEIECWSYGGSTFNGYVDDMTVT